MIFAILSDIHGNMEALEAVFKHAERHPIDRFLCLGDIVGYGANPKECLNRIKSFEDIVCVGNHDHAVTELTDTSYFNPYARKAVHWTISQLDEEDIAYINSLPYIYEEDTFYTVHANLAKPELWGYIFDDFDASTNFFIMKKNICFIGHSHVPLAFEKKEDIIKPHYGAEKILIDENCKYIVNVGSVGQPRDGDPRASYCIMDTEAKTIVWHRVIYDVAKAQKKIINAGLPSFLADRLAMGR